MKPKILYLGDGQDQDSAFRAQLSERYEVVEVQDDFGALTHMAPESYCGVYVESSRLNDALRIGRLLRNEEILEGMPDGVVLLDIENTIIWGNGRLCEWSGVDSVVGENFYKILGSPEILGPDFCPFHTALATSTPSSSTLRCQENRYFHVHAAPVLCGDGPLQHLIVTVRDVTQEMLQQQKLAAIHQAGIELADLTTDEIASMSVQERIDLLKSNIVHFTQDLLHFDVVEIRMLDHEDGSLEPLLSLGIAPEAAERGLKALPQGNGVTGFVASTGKSYLCEDTTEDPLYITGARDARSSLTVPLMFHDQVIGTFNVESPEARAFDDSDLQFLEIFSRDVAVAINTLDLLAAEKASTAAESVEAIHAAVAMPVDDILNDAVNVMEHYIGLQPEVVERLKHILRNARDIKQVIQKVGQKMAPLQAAPMASKAYAKPALVDRRVLVVDEDESVRSAAHALLERYGCVVETAHNGLEAVNMLKNSDEGENYDVILADIRLPDMTGYDFMLKLQEMMGTVPLILMTGFGYDKEHTLVKSRRAGLQEVLYKPFRLDQLLESVEKVIHSQGPVRLS